MGNERSLLDGKDHKETARGRRVNIETITPIPPDIFNNHGNLVISMEVMKVNTHNI